MYGPGMTTPETGSWPEFAARSGAIRDEVVALAQACETEIRSHARTAQMARTGWGVLALLWATVALDNVGDGLEHWSTRITVAIDVICLIFAAWTALRMHRAAREHRRRAAHMQEIVWRSV